MRKRNVFFLIIIFCLAYFANAQILPPYSQYFDSVNCTGWTHGAISGNDDWQRGVPTKLYMNQPNSPPKVWATNLTGVTSANSVMYLQTPSFDLSSLTKVYVLSFEHEFITANYHGGNIEYSTDGGVTWNLLNGTAAQKINWYWNPSCSGLSGKPAWSGTNYTSYMYSAHSLVFLQGQSNVKFRFYYGGTTNPLEGWMIDNFRITENVPDVIAMPGSQCNITKFFPTFTVTSSFVYSGLGPPSFSNTTNYYFSGDSILDAGDLLLGSKSQNVGGTISPWTATFTTLPNLGARNYYIFYKHDFAGNLTEFDENNNVGCAILHVDSTFTIPEWKDDFEGTKDWWKKVGYANFFEKGYSPVHQAEGTHSGKNSWYSGVPKAGLTGIQLASLESPFMDFTAANNNYICFWYRAKNTYSTSPSKLKLETSSTFTQGYTATLTIPFSRFTDWDCNCQLLWMMNGKNNGRIRITQTDGTTYALFSQAVNFDDVYIGQPKPDYTIEHKNILSTPVSLASDTLYYDLFNAGAVTAPGSGTEFYWSNDSLLDASDILLGTVSEPTIAATGYLKRKYLYTKPTTAPGTYFIIYKLDVGNAATEMWESNNIGYYKLKQDPLVALPYFNDFETQTNGWWHYASIGQDNWQWTAPSGTILTSAFSGSLAFNTTKTTPLPKMSRMHLYTPIFDFTTISNPVLEFDMKLNSMQACHCFEAKTNLSYSKDGGATWKVLDTVNQSFSRWYNPWDFDYWGGIDKIYYLANYTELLFQGSESSFATYDQYHGRDVDRNTKYIIDVPQLAGLPHVQFRYNTGSARNDTTALPMYDNFEGAVIDNFNIKPRFIDLMVPYKKSLMISGMRQKINFSMHIKNTGNYHSANSVNKYYVSADNILDASDYLIGSDTIGRIRPDTKKYINRSFNAPINLYPYKYLIYELDVTNQSIESNETNNVGYWPLALDSVSSFPYYQNFNDTILNGWHEYELSPYTGTLMQDQWRFRNQLAVADIVYQTQHQSGQMWTDMINNGTTPPFWYLETPSFDFTNHNSLEMKFDMALWGSNFSGQGGNMEYSINGGNTWAVLQPTFASQAYNWYTSSSLSQLGGPGWSGLFKPISILDSVWFDINFLSGQPNVVFRYKFRSNAAPSGNGTLQGMRIDNFRIKGNAISTGEQEQLTGFNNIYNYGNLLFVNYGILNDPTTRYELNVINMLGQNLYSKEIILNKGTNEFELPSYLPNGMYLVNLNNGTNNIRQKIMITR